MHVGSVWDRSNRTATKSEYIFSELKYTHLISYFEGNTTERDLHVYMKRLFSVKMLVLDIIILDIISIYFFLKRLSGPES